MKKIIIMIVVGLMAVFAIYQQFYDKQDDSENVEVGDSVEYDQNESQNGPLSIGQKAPNFELTKLNGDTAKLSDYRGKVVVLNFWATWCPPCRAEMPDLQKVYDNEENVEVLGVNLTQSEKGKNNVDDFVDELGITFPILLDKDSQTQDNYDINAYPTTYLIDKDGNIQYKALGAINYEIVQQELSKIE